MGTRSRNLQRTVLSVFNPVCTNSTAMHQSIYNTSLVASFQRIYLNERQLYELTCDTNTSQNERNKVNKFAVVVQGRVFGSKPS